MAVEAPMTVHGREYIRVNVTPASKFKILYHVSYVAVA